MKYFLLYFFALLLFTSCNSKEKNLVLSNEWFVAGPVVESEININVIRKQDKVVKITANDSPTGEIELNVPLVPVDPSKSNEGLPISLSDRSTFIEITYKSSHLIKLQAREGNEDGTGCVHGGSQPMADIPPSPTAFSTLRIPWSDFRLNGKPNGKVLDIAKLCKLNFVNYDPVPGAYLEITSVRIENY